MKALRTIILAAGKGTRMKSQIPKVLHPLCGRPMIEYAMDIARAVRSAKVLVVIGHQAPLLKRHLAGRCDVVVQKRLLGTADAVKAVLPQCRGYRGDILLICGDTPVLRAETIRDLVAQHRRRNAAATLLTCVVKAPRGYGRILRDAAGQVLAIREENDATADEKKVAEINVGAYCFQSEVLFRSLADIGMNKNKGEFYLTDIVELLRGQGQSLATLTIPDAVEGLGVNTRADLAKAEAVLRQRVLERFMLDGVTIMDPLTTFIHPDVQIGADTVIHPFTYIEDDVRIGKDCHIGPFCHLRPGTRLADKVTLGNFTEVSRSHLSEGTVMKHFGFLGDARIGKKVNVGAGVVTANYDGKNKNKTEIADQAFIGSDSILVAPVRIGRRALTGAGCVVTKGQRVPDGAVIFGVPGRIRPKTKRP